MPSCRRANQKSLRLQALIPSSPRARTWTGFYCISLGAYFTLGPDIIIVEHACHEPPLLAHRLALLLPGPCHPNNNSGSSSPLRQFNSTSPCQIPQTLASPDPTP